MKATVKDLRFHFKDLLETVGRGEEVVITCRGKPCAKLVPYEDAKKSISNNELFGIWRNDDATENVDEYVRNLRRGRF